MAEVKLSEKIGYALGDAAAGGITWKVIHQRFAGSPAAGLCGFRVVHR